MPAVELYRRHRPKNLDGILGQPEAVRSLRDFIVKKNVPHVILFVGHQGCGKTSMARILARELGCSKTDYCEINCAAVEGAIETVRSIQQRMGLAPIGGKCRVWVLDEIQSLSRASFAQQALLKMLEDTPDHCYFFLCTTDPGKILPTIKSRCTEIKVKPLSDSVVKQLLTNVAKKESVELDDDLIEKITEVAEGSARKALVILNQVIGLPEKERVEAIQKADVKKQAIELARELINPRGDWKKCAAILKDLEDDPEGVRRMILAYANSVLLGGGGLMNRAYLILECFSSPVWEMGRPGLTRAAYEVFQQK